MVIITSGGGTSTILAAMYTNPVRQNTGDATGNIGWVRLKSLGDIGTSYTPLLWVSTVPLEDWVWVSRMVVPLAP